VLAHVGDGLVAHPRGFVALDGSSMHSSVSCSGEIAAGSPTKDSCMPTPSFAS
jgi:hypothetical protein